jgi:hypothetical protein
MPQSAASSAGMVEQIIDITVRCGAVRATRTCAVVNLSNMQAISPARRCTSRTPQSGQFHFTETMAITR